MLKTEYFEGAISFALDQSIVINEIKKREKNGYIPIGVNMRLIHSAKLKKYFVQINFDFYRKHENHNLKEDLIVWLTRNNNEYKYYGMKHVHEVPDGLAS